MKKDKNILSALLDHLISSSENGEADDIENIGVSKDEPKDEKDSLESEPEDAEDDDSAEKMKRFLDLFGKE